MTYDSWLRRVRQLLAEEGLFPADFTGWDWARMCVDGCTPEEAAETALANEGGAACETADCLTGMTLDCFGKTLK